MKPETYIRITLIAELPGKQLMTESEVAGETENLGGMLEGAMYRDERLAALVIGAALFYCDYRGIDLVKYGDLYRKTFKGKN